MRGARSVKSAAFSEEWLEARLATLLPDYPDVNLCVALSGGVDSVSLLAALAKRPSIAGPLQKSSASAASPAASPAARRLRASSLRAIHIHHGLRPNADAWADHCSTLAAKLGVPLEVIRVKVPQRRGDSVEASARVARYAALARALQPGEVLLTAHHQDDQLETVLLQLLRGAGIAGLAAVAEVAPFARGRVVRPLLTCSRASLEEWARRHRLSWVEDDSNADERYDRNYLRHTVVPLIRERWPGAGQALSRAARHAAEARRLLDSLALVDVERAAVGPSLSAQRLRALEPDRRRNALRFWITRAGFIVPDTRRLEEIAGPLLAARFDANPQVRWNATVVERHADVLSIRKDAAAEKAFVAALDASLAIAAPEQIWRWRESPRFELTAPFVGTLSLVRDRHGPFDLDLLPEVLSVQARRGGEALRPAPGARTRKLKTLLQEAKLPPAERERLPLICAGGKLIAVADRWLDASVQATARTRHRARLRFSVGP
jgi:tRNA(Ile)-lysidine synthase